MAWAAPSASDSAQAVDAMLAGCGCALSTYGAYVPDEYLLVMLNTDEVRCNRGGARHHSTQQERWGNVAADMDSGRDLRRSDVARDDDNGKGMTLDGFRQWSRNRCPSFVRTVRTLLCGVGPSSRAHPQLEGGSGASLVRPCWAWVLSGALIPKQAVSTHQL